MKKGYDMSKREDSEETRVEEPYDLVDQHFLQDSPSPTNVAAKLLSKLRKKTTDGNHDAENDPSLSIVNNQATRSGELVIPDLKCDVAIRFSGKASTEIREWFIRKLECSGLVVSARLGCSGDYFLSVTTGRHMFLKGAEMLELHKRVHPNHGDGMKQFSRNEKNVFCPLQSTDGFLTAAERQLITYNYIVKVRTEEACEIAGVKMYHHESIVSCLINSNIVKQVYPLHQKSKQNVLNRMWVWDVLSQQPLNLVRHYFGEEIAMYFAWLGTYTCILVVPLIVGLVFHLFLKEKDSDWCFTFYAFFNVIWPTLFLEIWKRRSSALAWEWGTLGRDIEHTENQRPQFSGLLGENPVTKELELQYSSSKRQIKQLVSMLISLCCLVVVLGSMLAVFKFDDHVQAITTSGDFPTYIPQFAKQFIQYTPKVLLPITVGILDTIYNYIAVTLNDWENYKHQRTYEDWLVLKLILFKFVNHFLALFYIAFYLADFERLQETLAALLITKQVVSNFGEVLGPSLISWIKVYMLKRHADSTAGDDTRPGTPTQVELESEKPPYDCTFDDYLEMFIQMGYVILFSAAYPLAAVWAFLNNVVEIRSDAFKLVNGIQRPFIKRVQDIGFWQDAFELLSVVSIVVNCSLIGIRGQVGRWFPSFTVGQQILFVIMMEHVFLTIKYIISRAIPDVPDWVALEHAKEQHKRKQTIDNLVRKTQ